MKKHLYFLLFIAVATMSSCDYVSDPYPVQNVNIGDTLACPTPTFPAVTMHVKKIFLEDYTGHICPNCPRAARELHELDSINPGRIVAVAIHVGGLAAPSPGHGSTPSTAFTTDFRTTVGTEYDAVFGADAFGLPQGLFNRKDFDAVNQTHLKFYPNWATYYSTIEGEAPVADLQIINSFNDTTRQLCTAIKTSFIAPVSGTYKLAVLLVQDSIVDWQDDIDNGMVQNYVHRHVLRDAITPSGAWGDTIAVSGATIGDAVIKRYAYVIPTQYNGIPVDLHHCHVVAYVYNTATYEVIQCEDAKIQ
jgi:hypothetical protein